MAVITSPDGLVAVTVVVSNQESDGVYPVTITQITPTGQAVAIEYNGTRVFEGPAAAGSGTEG